MWRAVQRLVLRTHRRRIGVLWALAYGLVTRAVAGYLRAGNASTTVYLAGSFATGDPVYGLSDVDLVAVTPAGDDRLARKRRRRLREDVPLVRDLVSVGVYDEESFRSATASSCLTAERACMMAGGSLRTGDNLGLRLRPTIPPSPAAWRLLAGAERRRGAHRDGRLITAWLELQCWWRRAFGACCERDGPLAPYLCLKLFTEPARAWLWAVEGRTAARRDQVLELALRSMPDEESALRAALALRRSLWRGPEPPLEQALGFLRRTTSRLARELAGEAAQAGVTEVGLVGGDGRLPLVDWRARAAPDGRERWLDLVAGDPEDPADLARAARSARNGLQPALRRDDLLVLPTEDEQAALLRAVQCPQTDPVSFALVDGRATAAFPDLPGWSAHDCARRAVAEHAAWLRSRRSAEVHPGLLTTAARAALFLESLEAGEPRLALTTQAVRDELSARGGSPAGDLASLVAALPVYVRPAGPVPASRTG